MTTPTIRILFATKDPFPPWRVDVRVLFGKKLPPLGYRIDWLLPRAEMASPRPNVVRYGSGVAILGRTTSGSSRHHKSLRNIYRLANNTKILNLVKRLHPTFIQARDIFLSALPCLYSAKRTGTPFIYWLSFPHPEAWTEYGRHGHERYRLLSLFKGAYSSFVLYKILLPLSTHVFVQSAQMKADILKKHRSIPENKLSPIPMGIDLDEISSSSPHKLPTKQPTTPWILHVGTLTRARHLDFLLHVHRQVLLRHPTARLLFVGDSPDPADESFLRSQAQRLDISHRVDFLGRHPRSTVFNYIVSSDICLSPYYPSFILNSTSPTKLVEYLALGRPVVANDHPEQSLILQQSHAGIIVPWNIRQFAEAITFLLSHPSEAHAMGERGRLFVQQTRSYDRIAIHLDRIYRQLHDRH